MKNNLENIKFLDKLNSEQQQKLSDYIKYSEQYYTESSDITDEEFDDLTDELMEYNIPELTEFLEARIYSEGNAMMEITDDLNKNHQLLSLFKIKYKDKSAVSEIKKFFNYKYLNELLYAPKFDGGALKITWDLSTKLIIKIISRGGIDVTEKFKSMPTIQNTIKYGKSIITGELICPKKTFQEKYSDDFENPRNFVGKLHKQIYVEQSIVNDLVFISLTDGINALSNNIWKKLIDFNSLEEYITYYKSDEFPYECDGIVLAFNEPGERQIKGKYPLNMVAIKFPGERVRTKVTDFYWTQKKSGKLTPMALVEHKQLNGITITRANGFNYEYLLSHHIGIGSEVEVTKSGDIIPNIVKTITYSNNIKMPDCDYYREGKHLYAIDLEATKKYKFILGIKSLQLEGIGDVIAEMIGEVVNYDIIEVFNKDKKPDIYSKLGGGDRWLKFSQIYNIKNIYLDKLIFMLQFDQVGEAISKKVANLIIKKSTDTSNISSHVLLNVCRGEGFIKIKESVTKLKQFGITVLNPIEINSETITFEMTQDPPGMTKESFIKEVQKRYPNAIHTSLTKSTKYLFTDSLTASSSKMNKAHKYNVTIVTYQDFLNGKNLT